MYKYEDEGCSTTGWVRFKDVLYAWDNFTKSVVRLEATAIAIKDVPEEVIKGFLIEANKRRDDA